MKKIILAMIISMLAIGAEVKSAKIICSTKTQIFTYTFNENDILEYHLKAKGYTDRAEGRWRIKGNIVELYMFQEGTEFRESTILLQNDKVYWSNANEKKYTRECKFIEK